MNVLLLVTAIASVIGALSVLVSYVQYRTILQFRDNVDTSLQQAINDVAGDISTNIQETFANPNVKRAMSILGKESGQARASEATINQFKEALNNADPVISFISEKLGMEGHQLLEIWNDPKWGRIIQPLAAQYAAPFLEAVNQGIPQGSNNSSPNILNVSKRAVS